MMRLAAWLLVWLLWPGLAAATDGPRPPCDGPPQPHWPAAGELPRVQIWQTDDVTRLVALAGRFAHAGDGDALLARFAAVSALRGITYWSDREERWEELVLEAAALTSPDPAQRRDDFSLSELKAGTAHYFLQRDNRSSGIPMYRLRVLQRAPDRIVLNIANVSDVSYWRIPLFPPEALQSSYLLQRLGPGEWGYFSLSGSREPGMAFLLERGRHPSRTALLHYSATLLTCPRRQCPVSITRTEPKRKFLERRCDLLPDRGVQTSSRGTYRLPSSN